MEPLLRLCVSNAFSMRRCTESNFEIGVHKVNKMFYDLFALGLKVSCDCLCGVKIPVRLKDHKFSSKCRFLLYFIGV